MNAHQAFAQGRDERPPLLVTDRTRTFVYGSGSPKARLAVMMIEVRSWSDFTYVFSWQGMVYVAFVIDVFALKIVG
ncbi:transposase InsO family protein [Pseudochelatococcus contaminans]|uniref:Transposase InsO family protein n=1 Tax=Pseudochelatococcus contaminans TaxID=1538103 RepID=A0A7W6EHQ9_9HYPH|nr:transposase InsO family protein [Pseudochelatococcus contaminans]